MEHLNDKNKTDTNCGKPYLIKSYKLLCCRWSDGCRRENGHGHRQRNVPYSTIGSRLV